MAPPGWSEPFLLHHNPAAAADAEGIRGFLGETWVHPISVILHTSGALLIAGALLAVLLMTHRARTAPDPGMAYTIRSRALPWARGLVLGGWGLNLLGGTMRLFEPDHPGISEIGTVAWVQVLVLKHVLILAALVASLIAVEWAPRLWKRLAPQAAGAGIALVFFSAVLGGVSTGLPVPADEFDMGPASRGVPSVSPGEHVIEYTNTSFRITGNPLDRGVQEFPFQVDHWAFSLSVRLEWETEQTEIEARLKDPNGDVVRTFDPGPTRAQETIDVNLYPGTWTLVVESETALMEDVAVSVMIERGTAEPRVLEGTVTVDSGRFLELNFWMDPEDEFHYEWSVPSAHGPIYWDIHTHPDPNNVFYHEQGESDGADGRFVAGNEQIYSILWAGTEDRGFTITYRVEGDFRLHSIYP